MTVLPDTFTKRLKEQLGDEFDDYIKSFQEKHYNGLRVNTLKLQPEEFEAISPVTLNGIPWVKNGYYFDGEQPSKHPYYYAGLYYIQEPSAMTPASLLPIEPGDHVLDLCAAPGGKSTELAARLQGQGVLVSNDISNSRAKALLKNLEMFGVRNSLIISEAPNKLAQYFEGYFDKILVDAPCSGEGMFRKSPTIIKNWEQYGVEYYHKLQLEILPQALKMLKPGGYLLYSTCTFSPLENEGTLKFILEEYPDMEIVPAIQLNNVDSQSVKTGCKSTETESESTETESESIEIECNSEARQETTKNGYELDKIKQIQAESERPDYTGFVHGHPEWVSGPEEIQNSLRLWPHKIAGEGHFIALLRKKKSDNLEPVRNNHRIQEKAVISTEAEEFLSLLKFDIPKNRLTVREDRLFLLPDCDIDTRGLRIMRSGLLLGEMKKNRFEPSQALASSLTMKEYDNVYNLAASEPDVIRYLKCETIDVKTPCKDGWLLICVDGYPLGWAKFNNGNFKNKYLPGWRWM